MIFVDTGAWIAIFNPNDQYHREAIAIYNVSLKKVSC